MALTMAPDYMAMSLDTWFLMRERSGEPVPPRYYRGVACGCGCWADLVVIRNGEAEAKCAECAEREAT